MNLFQTKQAHLLPIPVMIRTCLQSACQQRVPVMFGNNVGYQRTIYR